METNEQMERLLGIMERLRAENGCPWDRAQTHESLKQYFLEEAYEVAEAIDRQDNENLCEELGDTLLQVVFHAQIAKEEGAFDFSDVARGISDKMVRRHPHVFGNAVAETTSQVDANWEAIKRMEKGKQSPAQAVRDIPLAMPALMRAQKVLRKADAPANRAEDDLRRQVEQALQGPVGEEEIGALLLSVVLLARKFQVNAELALTNATEQFINRLEGTGEKAVFQDSRGNCR